MAQPDPSALPALPPYPSAPSGDEKNPYQPQPSHHPGPAPVMNGFAVASLVLGILGGLLLSVIFGIVALAQMRDRPYRGKGLAIAGLAVSGAWVLGFVTMIVVAFVIDFDQAPADAVGGGGSARTQQFQLGDCLEEVVEEKAVLDPPVPCTQPHDGEIFASFALSGWEWPGEAQMVEKGAQGCRDRFALYAPAADLDALELYVIGPTEQGWNAGDHDVLCVATDPAGKSTGSIRD